MSERTVWRWDGLETAELGQAQLVAPERDGVGTPCPPCWDLLSCWTEYWTCHSSVMRRLLCLELIEFKSPQWQNMHRKGLMCINTDILKCNRCILLCEMYRLQRNYSNSYSPTTGKCIKKNHFVWIFLSQHISEQLLWHWEFTSKNTFKKIPFIWQQIT